MLAKPSKAFVMNASLPFRLAAPAWGFAHTQTRKLSQLSWAANQTATTPKWHGTQHDHFFRLDLTGT